jgi:hypothetical protein
MYYFIVKSYYYCQMMSSKCEIHNAGGAEVNGISSTKVIIYTFMWHNLCPLNTLVN